MRYAAAVSSEAGAASRTPAHPHGGRDLVLAVLIPTRVYDGLLGVLCDPDNLEQRFMECGPSDFSLGSRRRHELHGNCAPRTDDCTEECAEECHPMWIHTAEATGIANAP